VKYWVFASGILKQDQFYHNGEVNEFNTFGSVTAKIGFLSISQKSDQLRFHPSKYLIIVYWQWLSHPYFHGICRAEKCIFMYCGIGFMPQVN